MLTFSHPNFYYCYVEWRIVLQSIGKTTLTFSKSATSKDIVYSKWFEQGKEAEGKDPWCGVGAGYWAVNYGSIVQFCSMFFLFLSVLTISTSNLLFYLWAKLKYCRFHWFWKWKNVCAHTFSLHNFFNPVWDGGHIYGGFILFQGSHNHESLWKSKEHVITQSINLVDLCPQVVNICFVKFVLLAAKMWKGRSMLC